MVAASCERPFKACASATVPARTSVGFEPSSRTDGAFIYSVVFFSSSFPFNHFLLVYFFKFGRRIYQTHTHAQKIHLEFHLLFFLRGFSSQLGGSRRCHDDSCEP